MKRYNLAGLVILNFALLAALAMMSFNTPNAQAQVGGARGGSNYVMVAGKTIGSTQEAVYITDVALGKMIVVMYDQNQKALKPVAMREITDDFAAQQRR